MAGSEKQDEKLSGTDCQELSRKRQSLKCTRPRVGGGLERSLWRLLMEWAGVLEQNPGEKQGFRNNGDENNRISKNVFYKVQLAVFASFMVRLTFFGAL